MTQALEQFVNSLTDESLVEKLEIALNGKGAFRRFKDVLINYPVQREAWFKYEEEKVLQEVRDWVEVTAPHLLSSLK